MRALGFIAVGVFGLAALAIAKKTQIATAVGGGTAKPNSTPAPKPKPKAQPLIANAAVTALPAEIAKVIEEAKASKDPVFVRQVAAQLTAQYPQQAAELLNHATMLDWAVEPPILEP